MKIIKKHFGQIGVKPVYSYLLQNGEGMEVEVIEYGAIVRSIHVTDREGNISDVTLGYDNLEGYQNDECYFGATIGRVANRIGGASFLLNGTSHKLAANTLPDFGPNHLHGGICGLNKVLWEAEEFSNENEIGLRLKYLSKDGEEGYPGNLQCIVEYTLNENDSLGIRYQATTDKSTMVNMTHHSYFNLAGAEQSSIIDHHVQINSHQYTPMDDDLIPSGEFSYVHGLPVDFRKLRHVGSQLKAMVNERFEGFDSNYIINRKVKRGLEYAGRLSDPGSGRIMRIYTTQPCLHLYTSNFLDGEIGKKGEVYRKHGAICLEPQGYPDAPNHENFKSIVLNPDEIYEQRIEYQFSVDILDGKRYDYQMEKEIING